MHSPLDRGHRLISSFHTARKSLRPTISVNKPEKSENGLSPYRMSGVWSLLLFTKVNSPGEPQTRPAKSGVVPQVLKVDRRSAAECVAERRATLARRIRDEKSACAGWSGGRHPLCTDRGLSERGSHEFLAHIFSFPCMTHGPGLVQSEKMLLGPGVFVMACAHHEIVEIPERVVM